MAGWLAGLIECRHTGRDGGCNANAGLGKIVRGFEGLPGTKDERSRHRRGLVARLGTRRGLLTGATCEVRG